MIEIKNLTKKFGKNLVLDNLSFSVAKGEILGFLGPNGAGKTTTMKIITSFWSPTAGSILINGLDTAASSLATRIKIGYLPENNPLYGEMKVLEYLSFIAKVKNLKNNDEIIELSEKLDISEVMEKKIEELSRGFKQRVGLAAALLGDPTLLILDEPTSGLDPIEQDKIKNLIKNIAKNKTVIFSTHILSEVEDIASRLIIINQGSLVYDGKKPKGRGAVDKLFKKLVKKT